jgi:soluble cytochrome b562
MQEKEKYRAQIEGRLMKFGESLYEITNKLEQRKDDLPDLQIAPILKKQEAVETKLKDLDEADESNWQKYKTELDDLVAGIDEDLRTAMTYFG